MKNSLLLVLGRANYMRIISLKTSVLAFMLVASASLIGGVITGCASTGQSQNQVPNTNVTDTSATQDGMQGMEHGSGMTHDKAMDLGPADANYDLRFIDAMRLHHRGAIVMAEEAQQKSQRPEIRKLAGNIIEAQTREENKLLREWRSAWYPQAGSEFVTYDSANKSVIPMSEQQKQSMAMLEALGAADDQFDLRFMNAMIAHHEAATQMAQDALSKSKRSEVKQLAQEIIDSQQAEIDQMKQWRQVWYQK